MQRPEAKNPPERPLLSAETGNVENRWQDPPRNGLFSIDNGFGGSGRLDGGDGRDQTANPPRSHSNQSLAPESGTEIFDAETGAQNRPLRLLETDPETLSSVSRIPGVNCGRPSAVVLELARYRI
jgi:hypothetical protein